MNLTTLSQPDLASPTAKAQAASISASSSDKSASGSAAGFGQLMAPVKSLEKTELRSGSADSSLDMAGLLELLKQFGEEAGITVDQDGQTIQLEEGVITLEQGENGLSIQLDGEDVSLQQMMAALTTQISSDKFSNTEQLMSRLASFQQQIQRIDANSQTTAANGLMQMLQASNANNKPEGSALNQALIPTDLMKPQVKSVALDANLVAVLNNAASGNSATSDNLQFKATVENSRQGGLSELGQKLNNILADKISVQLSSKTQVATVRLDPPDLGKIELNIKVEHDKLQVQINASSHTTRESLNLTAERLRHELMGQNFLSVEVSIQQDQGSSSNEAFSLNEDEAARTNIASNDSGSKSLGDEKVIDKELARA